MGRLILLFIAIVAAVVFVNWLLKEDPKKVAKFLRRGGLWLAVLVVVLLAATGKLNPIFAAIAAAIPFLGRMLSVLRFLPIFSHLFTQYQNSQASGTQSSGGVRTSRVQSKFLVMTLNHDTGEMDGEILEGNFEGKNLSELNVSQLKSLLDHYRQADGESYALLEAYLDRVHGDQWREEDGEEGPGSIHSGPMTEREAREILGVADDASEADIVDAHRRLMQKLHPDRGGSTYLAAKINQAKDLLCQG